jgi:putative ABC transport system permease protein
MHGMRGGVMIDQVVGEAVATLRRHPLRTLLGALAIFVAVLTVALVRTGLAGFAAYARQTAERAFGSETFVLAQIASSGQTSRRELERKLARHPPIRRADVRAIRALTAGAGVRYAPNARRDVDVVAGGRKFENAAVTGTTAELAEMRDLGLAGGRFLTADDEIRAAQVAVVGMDLVDALFPGRNPVGESIRIAGRRFEVVGFQGRLGQAGGASLDRYVWIPLSAFERAFGAPPTLQIFARGAEGTALEEAEGMTRAAMRARRRLTPGVEDTFDILVPDAARSFVLALSQRIGVAGLPIAFMALLAAVVVVTNTVLVSVSQRTREIGVRRALGATRRQIVAEVLAESGLVALGGGAAGLSAAWVIVGLVARVTGLPLALDGATAAWSLAASVASGVAAGWYPARRASSIDVVAALRAE